LDWSEVAVGLFFHKQHGPLSTFQTDLQAHRKTSSPKKCGKTTYANRTEILRPEGRGFAQSIEAPSIADRSTYANR
jgi:hypothetical protein